MSPPRKGSKLMVLLCVFMAFVMATTADNFLQDVDINWGSLRTEMLEGGRHLTLSLDKDFGFGFQSKEFLFVRFHVQMKLVPGNSTGTITTFYLSSQGATHDEIDFEFLGNSLGDLPTSTHKEREIVNNNFTSVLIPQRPSTPTPSTGLHEALNDWPTRGGLVKTDWTQAPFTASYKNFNANGCVASFGTSSCSSKYADTLQGGGQNDEGLDAKSRNRL